MRGSKGVFIVLGGALGEWRCFLDPREYSLLVGPWIQVLQTPSIGSNHPQIKGGDPPKLCLFAWSGEMRQWSIQGGWVTIGGSTDPQLACGPSSFPVDVGPTIMVRSGYVAVLSHWFLLGCVYINPCTWRIYHQEKTHASDRWNCLRVCFLACHLDWGLGRGGRVTPIVGNPRIYTPWSHLFLYFTCILK